MKQIKFIIISLLVFLSCNKVEKPERPENLIPKDKMADILFDVFVFNGAKGTDRRVLEKHNVNPDVFIFEKYQIDSLQFAKSNEFYAYDVKTYEGIINKVEAKIKAKKEYYEAEVEKEEERRKKRLDSIRDLGKKKKEQTQFNADNANSN
ncbi:MAG: DUF4296 domain-containing protein [Psychroserpens sp.]|nr:DUF4296 domain-containing protein [Psychroserpens sp.]